MSAAPIALALYEPDIAANAGAMMRTCACLGIDAAIIEPAGFPVSDRRFRRSGMDYLDRVAIERHASFERFETWRRTTGRRLVLLTTKGESRLWDFAFRPGDVLMVPQRGWPTIPEWGIIASILSSAAAIALAVYYRP